MPLGPTIESEILQNQHRIAGRNLGKEITETRLQRIDEKPSRTGGSDHLHLQTAFALGNVDLLHKRFRRCINITLRKHGCQRSWTALVVLLRVKRHIHQLGSCRELCMIDKRNCRSRAAPEQTDQQQYEQPLAQRLMQLTKLKMLVAQSMSVMMKITRNSTITPTTPAPAGA